MKGDLNRVIMVYVDSYENGVPKGTAYQNFVYTDEHVSKVNTSSGLGYTLNLYGLDTLLIDLSTLKVYGMLVTESGATIAGEVWRP